MRQMRRDRVSRASRLRVFLLTIVVAPLSLGCGDTLEPTACTEQFEFGLLVDVHEGTGGPGAQGAIGVAIEGAFADTLQLVDDVRLVGAGERPGTYDVTIQKTGFATWTASNITVTADECHVIPVRLEAVLIPVVSINAIPSTPEAE